MSSVNENLQASNDEAIVKRVQEGDVNAYNILVIKYQHRVAQIISKFLNSSDDVSDVAQEAFIKAYKAINSFRGESSFYTWLYRIVVNAAKSYIESNSKHKHNVDVDSEEFQGNRKRDSCASFLLHAVCCLWKTDSQCDRSNHGKRNGRSDSLEAGI